MSLLSDLVSAATSNNPEKQDSPVQDTTGSTNSGLINSLTGSLSKAIDTGVDVWATKLAAPKTTQTVGQIAPTGQVSPEAAASQNSANKTGNAGNTSALIAPKNNLKMYLIIGGVAAVLLIGTIIVLKKK